MGETSFIGWFITLGDLGPEQTFFFGLELLYEERCGKPAVLGRDAEYALREMWLNGCPLADWIRAVLAQIERASLAGGMSNGRAR
jgi:hypothetical protein